MTALADLERRVAQRMAEFGIAPDPATLRRIAEIVATFPAVGEGLRRHPFAVEPLAGAVADAPVRGGR